MGPVWILFATTKLKVALLFVVNMHTSTPMDCSSAKIAAHLFLFTTSNVLTPSSRHCHMWGTIFYRKNPWSFVIILIYCGMKMSCLKILYVVSHMILWNLSSACLTLPLDAIKVTEQIEEKNWRLCLSMHIWKSITALQMNIPRSSSTTIDKPIQCFSCHRFGHHSYPIYKMFLISPDDESWMWRVCCHFSAQWWQRINQVRTHSHDFIPNFCKWLTQWTCSYVMDVWVH